jgi:DNA replication and repair protein RecF
LEPLAAAHHWQISAGQESLTLMYESALYPSGNEPPPDLPDRFRQLLAERRHVEEIRGTTVVGPHRDDLQVSLNGHDARQFASQGQQRSAVLSLKLAELAFIAAHVGEPPVLLLDDVTSELDADRRSLLVQAIAADVQTFITTTGLDDVDQRWLEGGAVFTVSGGDVQPLGTGGTPTS